MRLNERKHLQRLRASIRRDVGLLPHESPGWLRESAGMTGIRAALLPPGVTVASLFQGGPAGDLEQIDAYLEALLKEDHLPTTLNRRTLESGQAKNTEQWKDVSKVRKGVSS